MTVFMTCLCCQKICSKAVNFMECNKFHSCVYVCNQVHLSEGLINEAEKLLCSLVCWFTDRQIRMRFIEGCLDNLAHHR